MDDQMKSLPTLNTRLTRYGSWTRMAALLAGILCLSCFSPSATLPKAPTSGGFDGQWASYGRDRGGSRYSPLKQIDRGNVSRLELAWSYRSGDVNDGSDGRRKTKFEATPILFGDTLYFSTPFSRVIALDPETGQQRWSFDPKIDLRLHYSESLVSRGVSSWTDSQAADGAPCRGRIAFASLDARLHSLDAASGKPCADFGDQGQVDLKVDVGRVELGEYEVTSPPAVIGDLVIVGSALGDNRRVEVERGVVRAFDARNGQLRWAWDPIPRRPGTPGWETWSAQGARKTGAANAWSIISTDPARGLVFVPTGSAAPDFYGGERLGANLFANSVVALRASTGEVVWHFQVVHHDIWDYDVAAQPLLTTVRRQGREVAAVVVNTKMGHVFVLHRETGKPLFPVEERPVPRSDVEGESASPTQPFPVLPPPLHRKLEGKQAWGMTPQDQEFCQKNLDKLRYQGIFTPPSLQGTLVYPGFAGGVNWGGAAADPVTGRMVVNLNHLPFWVRLIPRHRFDQERRQARTNRLDAQFTSQSGTPYGMSRNALLSPNQLPCTPPPWGQTVAVDLNSGKILWEVPTNSHKALGSNPAAGKWGSLAFGGPILTAGGLVFTAGDQGESFRALDAETGRQLWSADLPAGGNATPMTYQLRPDGRQYVVIAAGGHGDLGTTLGDYVLAYALPE